MAKKRKPLTRSEIAKKGWVTRRRNIKKRKKQVGVEVAALAATREVAELKEERAELQREIARLKQKAKCKPKGKKPKKRELDEVNRELAEKRREMAESAKELEDLRAEMSDALAEMYQVYKDVDVLYDKRRERVSEEQYRRLLTGETHGDFRDVAEEIAGEMECDMSEIYDLWLSP
jgi:seryl-tRNA synthetase